MILYHWTPRHNLRSILMQGLRIDRGRGARQRLWFADHTMIAWAWTHVAAHQNVNPWDMLLLRVRMAPSMVRRWNRAGIYTCRVDVPPERITQSPIVIRRGRGA